MKNLHPPLCRAVLHLALSAALLSAGAAAGAQGQHAHTHGRLSIDVAVDAGSITISVESPLDNLLGFERAPRNEAERKLLAEVLARLQAADRLFVPDPAAQCRLAKVSLVSATLGIGADGGERAMTGRSNGDMTGGRGGNGGSSSNNEHHADLDATILFTCQKSELARFIDVKLFEQFPRVRTADAQVASPQGQFKRMLDAKSPRLAWGK